MSEQEATCERHPMNQPVIVIRYRNTPGEVLLSYRVRSKWPRLWIDCCVANAVVGFFLLGGVAITSLRIARQAMPNFSGVVGLLIGLVWFTRGHWIPRLMVLMAGPLSGRDVEATWQLTSEGVTVRVGADDLWRPWDSYVNVICDSEGVMLFLTDTAWHWLPRHAFASDEDYERVVSWAQERILVSPK